MHDPSVLVFTLHLPIPGSRWKWANDRPRGLRRWRYEAPGEPLDGQPIHPWWRPAGWRLNLRGSEIKLMDLVDVWHEEPGGADSGEVCKGMGSTELTWHNVKWAIRHRRHLRLRWQTPLRTLHRWYFQRCDDCKQRFGYHEARYGTGWDSDETVHRPCLDLRHQRYWIEDLEKTLSGEPRTWTERWRVEYRLKRDLEWDVDNSEHGRGMGRLAGTGVAKDARPIETPS